MDAVSDVAITEGGQMEFRLFGEVELRAAGQLLDVGTPRQQAVLAALIVDVGRPVAIETLVDRVWDATPPVGARNVLYSHLSRIRHLFRHAAARTGKPTARVERQRAGYVLDVDPDLVDLHRFCRLIDQGCQVQRTDAARADALAEALGLWRGLPLAALSGLWVTQVRNSWHRRRLDAVAQWAQAELRLGHPATVIHVLHDLVGEYPLVEPLEGLLMRALHAAGRGAEALDRYTHVRHRLAHDLGTDPGPELRSLHQAILRGELPPPSRADPPAEAGKPLAAPVQLPPDTPGFTGRDPELHHLESLAATAHNRSTATVIITVSGTAGAGKTALAVHWAHRVRAEFPDGQLYVNLRGFDPTGSPVKPAEAIRRFLDAFDVPSHRVPIGFEAQVGLYRSLLADRRVLVILDNARDAEQVRPLLPGTPTSLALVTSRNQLSGLVAEGAHPLTLDLLPASEARELLTRRLGADRTAAEPHAVDEIITLCARLPLALVIVAARAATHPQFCLGSLAAELRETRGGLDEFAGADPATNVRSVFSWSYQQLSPTAARLFRQLGVHPGPDVATPAVASLAGLTPPQVRSLLTELAQAHLIAEHNPGRYTFHDLLRAYAAELAHTHDAETERAAALHRMLDHYVHTARGADRLLNPHRDDDLTTLAEPRSGAGPEYLADHAQALTWFNAERSVLLTVVRRIVGFDAQVWQLAWTLTRFFGYQGHWRESVDVLNVALDAARRLADSVGQAFAHRFLGCTYIRLGHYDKAHTHLLEALDLYRETSDHAGEANTERHFSWLLEQQGRYRQALPHARRALDLFRVAGHRAGEARALNAIGWFHAQLGDYEEALGYCQQALDLQKELGDRFGQAETGDSLGYAHHHLGQYAQAIACYEAAAELYREFDNLYDQATVLVDLGNTHRAAGNLESASATWQNALDVLDQLGLPDADKVQAIRTKLNELHDRDDYPPGGRNDRDADQPVRHQQSR